MTDTPDTPDTIPGLHDDLDDEDTSPGGHAIPPPPPDGRIDAAPPWVRDLLWRLDALHADVRILVDDARDSRARIRRLEERSDDERDWPRPGNGAG